MKKNGYIKLFIGPMYAGKSTEVLREIKRFAIAKRRGILIKYTQNTYYDPFCTHDQQVYPAFSVKTLSEIEEKTINETDVIGIDEGHFFPDLDTFCENMANNGKVVIVSALSGDSNRENFPNSKIFQLIPKAEYVIKLSAICDICGKDASYSKIITEKNELSGKPEKKYIAVCRECFFI